MTPPPPKAAQEGGWCAIFLIGQGKEKVSRIYSLDPLDHLLLSSAHAPATTGLN